MKSELRGILALAALALFGIPATGAAEVRRVELDVAGYLCGL